MLNAFVLLVLITCSCCRIAAKQQSDIAGVQDALRADFLEQRLSETLEKSLYIGRVFKGEEIKEKVILERLDQLFKDSVRVGSKALTVLFTRDGGGWIAVTNPDVLQSVLDQYLQGPDSREDKNYWLNRFLCKAILISDPGIVEMLITKGANPHPKDIWNALMHITPDYFPTYETICLLVDEMGFDLYRCCNVTPIWWLVYERAQNPDSRNSRVLAEEMEKRKVEADWICNSEKGGGYFLDPEIFPSNKNAWELAECFEDQEMLKYKTE